jgi:small subunit ribosomal protein S6
MASTNMKLYELTYLISPEVSEEELKSLNEKINSLIQKGAGALNEIKPPIKKKLAYPIKKQNEAFLIELSFYLEPEKLGSLEKELKAEKKILRYLILAKPKLKIIKLRKRPKKVIPKPLKEKKVELKEIEKKLEEILKE